MDTLVIVVVGVVETSTFNESRRSTSTTVQGDSNVVVVVVFTVAGDLMAACDTETREESTMMAAGRGFSAKSLSLEVAMIVVGLLKLRSVLKERG